MRFSGHESFACRYAWLPKAYAALAKDPRSLADEDAAMVSLGVGKNMVRSIRFWIEVMDVAVPAGGRTYELTRFARDVFGPDGHDPFLEDERTLWLLHWKVATHADDPVFAWRFLLNHWPYPELTRTEAVDAFMRESSRLGHSHSPVTLGQHFDVFLHTYVSTRGKAGASGEDSLDGPLVELEFLEYAGERRTAGTGKRETVYAFRREPKPEITRELFEYCLDDYWTQWHATEATLTFRDVATGICALGPVFRLPEDDLRTRLDLYVDPQRGAPFAYQPSAVQGLLTRRPGVVNDFLSAVYQREVAHG